MYKDALVHLMTGCAFMPQSEEEFWEVLLEANLNHHLWFKLKLASYNLRPNPRESGSFI